MVSSGNSDRLPERSSKILTKTVSLVFFRPMSPKTGVLWRPTTQVGCCDLQLSAALPPDNVDTFGHGQSTCFRLEEVEGPKKWGSNALCTLSAPRLANCHMCLSAGPISWGFPGGDFPGQARPSSQRFWKHSPARRQFLLGRILKKTL